MSATVQNRWWITGTLTTASSLHIGNGEVVPDDRRVPTEDKPDSNNPSHWADVSAVVTDVNGKPWIPGAGLRGALRAWLYRHVTEQADKDHLDQLFGRGGENVQNEEQTGGRLSVYGLVYASDAIPDNLKNETLHFDNQRRTLVEAGVAIDRVRGSAIAQKLYYQEVIPPGVRFKVELEARDVDDRSIQLLLAGLDAFNRLDLVLGAETRNAKGRCRWALASVRRCDTVMLKNWVDNAIKKSGKPLEQSAETVPLQPATLSSFSYPRLEVTLKFDTLLCVDDPGRALWAKEEKKKLPNDSNDPRLTDKLPRVDANGKAFLPAKSFRGVLRAQFERIARTLGIDVCGESMGIKSVRQAGDADKLCFACQLFGAPGWATLLNVSDFIQINNVTAGTITQEFVAIDRFTGGGSEGKKFNAQAVVQPTLLGRLRLDETRLAALTKRESLLALLALALRDLKEGGLNFGLGAAKGYGACRSEFGVAAGGEWKTLADWLQDPARPLAGRNSLSGKAPEQPKPGALPAIPAEPIANASNPGNNKFYNPYHFVPVANPRDDATGWVGKDAFDSGQLGACSHARYLNAENGKAVYSGRIICRLTAETPFFVGAHRTQTATEAKPAIVEGFDFDGKPAIPASSLRGLISSLVEAATGSALRVLDDRVLSFRRAVGEGLSAIGMLKKSKTNIREFDLVPLTMPTLQTRNTNFELSSKWKKVFDGVAIGYCLPVYLVPGRKSQK